jgi:hypothetical protein
MDKTGLRSERAGPPVVQWTNQRAFLFYTWDSVIDYGCRREVWHNPESPQISTEGH